METVKCPFDNAHAVDLIYFPLTIFLWEGETH